MNQEYPEIERLRFYRGGRSGHYVRCWLDDSSSRPRADAAAERLLLTMAEEPFLRGTCSDEREGEMDLYLYYQEECITGRISFQLDEQGSYSVTAMKDGQPWQ